MRQRAALCVPASEAKKVSKALALNVDQVVVDLEDAVALSEKDTARAEIANLHRRDQGTVAVRVNAMDTTWFESDLRSCVRNPAIDFVVLPKIESADQMLTLASILSEMETDIGRGSPMGVQALLESARAISDASLIARSTPRLDGLILGYADLAASLRRAPQGPWGYARDAVLFAARAAGIRAIDGPRLSILADDHLSEDATHAFELGFDGKWVLHPQQVVAVQAAFSPTADDVELAQEQLAAMAEADSRGVGAVQWKGQMLDEAVAVRARWVLSQAGVS